VNLLMSEERWLVAGLGNPGPEYAGTRHNAGYMVADLLAERMGVRFKAHRSRNEIAEGRLAGVPVTLAKPRTYMNLSGGPVAALSAFYKIPAERIVVVHDDLDIPFGSVRIKFGGGDNGHNGLRSITQALGTNEYIRVRLGIGRPPGRMDAATYVLRDFSAAERKELPFVIDRGADAVETVLSKGVAVAQNTFHADLAGPRGKILPVCRRLRLQTTRTDRLPAGSIKEPADGIGRRPSRPRAGRRRGPPPARVAGGRRRA
jgi:PTH1 family peptidyl-tRNA hydrolase